MTPFSVIRISTGQVLRSGTCQPHMVGAQAQGPDEVAVAEDASDALHYFDTTTLHRLDRRPPTPNVVTTQGEAILSGLPVPCTVHVGADSAEVTGGAITLTFDLPGTYTARLRGNAQYLDTDLTLEIP